MLVKTFTTMLDDKKGLATCNRCQKVAAPGLRRGSISPFSGQIEVLQHQGHGHRILDFLQAIEDTGQHALLQQD